MSRYLVAQVAWTCRKNDSWPNSTQLYSI